MIIKLISKPEYSSYNFELHIYKYEGAKRWTQALFLWGKWYSWHMWNKNYE